MAEESDEERERQEKAEREAKAAFARKDELQKDLKEKEKKRGGNGQRR